MGTRTAIVAFGALALGACSFHPGAAPSGDDSVVFEDAPLAVPDAGPCPGTTAACANANTLRTCADSHAQPVDTMCDWGCLDDSGGGGPRCGVLAPHGGSVISTDLAGQAGLADVELSGTLHDDGQITGGTNRPSGPGVIGGIGFRVGANNVGIYTFKNLHVAGTVQFSTDHAIALVATESIRVDDDIDGASACDGNGGTGLGGHSGGGSNGGGSGGPGNSGGGHAGGGFDGNNGAGGGGAGGGAPGGMGGDGGQGGGGQGGALFGDSDISLLDGGGGGGGGGGTILFGGHGGGGGGAIQLAANGTIAINSGGSINANACSGRDGSHAGAPVPGDGGGGGGGAGGVILIEGLAITVNGHLAVNGGDGGDGAMGGGHGGTGAGGTTMGGGSGTNGANRGGGGGGGVGRIRLNTRTTSGTMIPDPSKVSPEFGAPGSTTTTGLCVVR